MTPPAGRSHAYVLELSRLAIMCGLDFEIRFIRQAGNLNGPTAVDFKLMVQSDQNVTAVVSHEVTAYLLDSTNATITDLSKAVFDNCVARLNRKGFFGVRKVFGTRIHDPRGSL